ncbi:hypothetical protein [Rufibacter sp. XAAS-G3-1]|uniref:hypothetical protein n=1 Tax=Rufibacter sp. XAAS-G3-1 TaxID=2729134 RepID=UPI0015E73D84|nr:hypothetical protein [Rufibacter sp. XAAS-G3-1]
MGKKSTKKKKKDKSNAEEKNTLGKGLTMRLKKAVKHHGAEMVTELVTALIASYVSSRKKNKAEAKLTEAAKSAIGKEAQAAIETINQSSQASKKQPSNSAKDTSATPDAVVLVKVEISDPSTNTPAVEETSVSPTQEETSVDATSDTPQENEKEQA